MVISASVSCERRLAHHVRAESRSIDSTFEVVIATSCVAAPLIPERRIPVP